MQTINNLLNVEEFRELQDFYTSADCPWYYNSQVNQFSNNNFYFTQNYLKKDGT